MKNGSAKLLLVFVVISMVIGSSYCYVMSVRGQGFANPPIKGWIDISPNPAYLGEDIKITITVLSEELFDKQVRFHAKMAPTSPVPEVKAITVSPECQGKIPKECWYGTSTDELLKDLIGGWSAECIIQMFTEVEGYRVTKVAQETFHIYNYSRPPDKPYLLLKKSLEKGDGLKGVVTVEVEVENIGSGNAKNVEIKHSLPPSFALVSGSITQKYDNIRPSEHKTFKCTILPLEDGAFILDSATATYEDIGGNSYSSTSNPFMLNVEPPIPTSTQPATTAPVVPSPTPSPTPTPSSTPTPGEPTPLEQTPSPTSMPPDKGKGKDGTQQLVFIISAIALVSSVVLFKPVMLKYYEWKMKKWEKEGYDVSKLKEVLKK